MPYLGHIVPFLRNCNDLFDGMVAKHGRVYSNKYAGKYILHLMTPDANEFVLLDRDKNFSSRLAWNRTLKNLFPNGLMLRDGDDHRHHRRLLGAPFKAEALKTYVDIMNPQIEKAVDSWHDIDNFLFYKSIKELTLSLASGIFIGELLDDEAARVNQAFVDLVNASAVIVRYPMFGNKYQRGLQARAYLEEYFRTRIPKKRQSEDTDMFAEICRAKTDDDQYFSDQDIIDHIIFLMMAAHDTTTSSLSSVCYALSKSNEWQETLRSEISVINDDHLIYSRMGEFSSAGLVLKEALRLYPPLPVIPRRAVSDCEFDGYQISKGQQVIVSPYFTQRLPEIWSEPNTFDPERFSKERAEDLKHKHAWIPFGGGAHKCLGIHFAELQIKLVLFKLLKRYEISVGDGYEMPYQPAPIGKPIDLLPLTLKKIQNS